MVKNLILIQINISSYFQKKEIFTILQKKNRLIYKLFWFDRLIDLNFFAYNKSVFAVA